MTNRIHPTAVVGPGVDLGTGNVIGPYAVLLGPCRIGDDNWIGAHVVLGAPPEIRGFDHGAAWDGDLVGAGVSVGDRTTLREYTTVHSGSAHPTRIGSDCFVMNKVYVGHDGSVGDGVTMASNVTMGGHVTVGERANLGLGAIVHQRRVIGPGVMLGMGTVVTHDVPPFAKAFGNPVRVQGVNAVGMSRQGLPDDDAAQLAALYADGGRLPDDWSGTESLQPALSWWRTRARVR
ncbi:UDP-N-acetylglucosamine acyltransferase [Blastococcus colisei]|uniref:UDP-N-acetylglucosamine acyltransferase n=1 Tax=Blastococcus colisei TaxID=1564162 RepID=A0A543PBV8_9ACTN|nr:acyl-ACP--UDP-N- acetylglucosamine O-acyltransferase [Blastococcus colisei]TQN41500.1 UDP-N-acetylglucosamine acyltransferase [Blastococcus colisei]